MTDELRWADAKWAEVERRMMALEERTTDLVLRLTTHEAVCLERQKTMLNTMASVQVELTAVDAAMTKMRDYMDTKHMASQVHIDGKFDKFSSRLNSWLTAITGAAVLSTGSLAVLILTHGLK